jgi:hypothetical protein
MAETVAQGFLGSSVWGVHHIHHHYNPLRHRDKIGRVRLGKWDNMFFIGWFESQLAAESAVRSIKTQPGFVDEPDCFVVVEYPVDVDLWPLGLELTLRRTKP